MEIQQASSAGVCDTALNWVQESLDSVSRCLGSESYKRKRSLTESQRAETEAKRVRLDAQKRVRLCIII